MKTLMPSRLAACLTISFAFLARGVRAEVVQTTAFHCTCYTDSGTIGDAGSNALQKLGFVNHTSGDVRSRISGDDEWLTLAAGRQLRRTVSAEAAKIEISQPGGERSTFGLLPKSRWYASLQTHGETVVVAPSADKFDFESVSELPVDPTFDRYLDRMLLGKAWAELDPALMADLGFQLAEGERILLRPHKTISADEVLKLAGKIAVDRQDQATLGRLQKHFRERKDQSMSDWLNASIKLASETRSVDTATLISVDTTSPENFAIYRGIIGEINAAGYVEDREALDVLTDRVESLPGLTVPQREHLRSMLRQRDAMTEDGGTSAAAKVLQKLAASSRDYTVCSKCGTTVSGFATGNDSVTYTVCGSCASKERQEQEEQRRWAEEARRRREERLSPPTTITDVGGSTPSPSGGGGGSSAANERARQEQQRREQQRRLEEQRQLEEQQQRERQRQREEQRRAEERRREEQRRREERQFVESTLPALPGSGLPARGNGDALPQPPRPSSGPDRSRRLDLQGMLRITQYLQDLGDVRGDVDKTRKAESLIRELQLQQQLAEIEMKGIMDVLKEAELLRRQNGRLTSEQQQFVNQLQRRRVEILTEKQKALPVLRKYLPDMVE